MTDLDSRLSAPARPFQMLPPLDDAQRHILRQSIEQCGVLEPVVFDEDGEILDGHHRVEIAEELGIDYPSRVITDLDRPGKWMYAVTVNVARRHLDQSTRSGLVAQMRLRGMSIREIAKAAGVSRGTVANDLAQLSNSGQLEQPERITGADGRERPSTRPTQIPGPTGAAQSPPADPGATPAPAHPSPSAPAREPAPTPEPDAAPSTAPSGSGPVEAVAPATREGAGATAEAGAGGDFRDHVLAVLRPDEEDAWGLDDICSRLPGYGEPGQARPGQVREVLAVLVEAGLAGVGRDSDGPYWWKTGPKKPKPPPGSPTTWTPEQKAANQREVDRKRMVADGQKAAQYLVMSVRTEISMVVKAIDLGEQNLITEQMIADLRRAIDLLESRLGVNA